MGNTYLYDKDCRHGSPVSPRRVPIWTPSLGEGGRYDGAAGVITGLMRSSTGPQRDHLGLPIRVGATRCEESSNFGRSTIGSGLITKEVYKHDIGARSEQAGGDAAGGICPARDTISSPSASRASRNTSSSISSRERCWRSTAIRWALCRTIAGPRRFNIHIHGNAEHLRRNTHGRAYRCPLRGSGDHSGNRGDRKIRVHVPVGSHRGCHHQPSLTP